MAWKLLGEALDKLEDELGASISRSAWQPRLRSLFLDGVVLWVRFDQSDGQPTEFGVHHVQVDLATADVSAWGGAYFLVDGKNGDRAAEIALDHAVAIYKTRI